MLEFYSQILENQLKSEKDIFKHRTLQIVSNVLQLQPDDSEDFFLFGFCFSKS